MLTVGLTEETRAQVERCARESRDRSEHDVDQQPPAVVRPVHERPLTIFLNSQEIVTAMTIGDHPDWLAVGYLLNQGMLKDDDEITGIDHDDDLEVIVVRTKRETNFEEKMKKKTRTSGCAQGTVFGDMMENFETIELSGDATIRTSWLYELTKKINTAPSLYLKAGATHGCVLCQGDRPLVFAPRTPLLVTAGSNGLKLWNTRNWHAETLGPCRTNAAAVFSPNGNSLIDSPVLGQQDSTRHIGHK